MATCFIIIYVNSEKLVVKGGVEFTERQKPLAERKRTGAQAEHQGHSWETLRSHWLASWFYARLPSHLFLSACTTRWELPRKPQS